jgi:hypothetical protein
VTDELSLRWVATQFNNDPPEVDDGKLLDEHAPVGRCRLSTQNNPKGWVWTLTCGSGREPFATKGVEETKEAGKAALERAYRAWVALDHPDNRAFLVGDAKTRRAIQARWVERARAAERDGEP